MRRMKKGGLTLEQERAAQLISLGKRISDKEIAKEVGVAVGTLMSWKNSNIRFKLRVAQLFEDNVDAEKIRRSKRIRNYLIPIYKQILKKIRNEKNLDLIPLRDLIRMMAQLHSELRLDINLGKKTKVKDEVDEAGLFDAEIEESEELNENDLLKARSNYVRKRKEIDNSQKVVNLFKGGSAE